jgi:CRP-like cAMP-binding protein
MPNSAFDEATEVNLLERLQQIPLFEGMIKEDMIEIAKSATLHIVAPPKRIVRAGALRASMFLIASGEADIYEINKKGKETWMMSAGESETLELLSLLTEAPQRTTTRAKVESTIWEISSESIHTLFGHNPRDYGEHGGQSG